MFRSDPAATYERVQALADYMDANVLAPSCHDGGAFVCSSAAECRQSAGDADFYEGQLSHVGDHFDLWDGDQPLRIVVVGQELGYPPARVGLPSRRQAILTGSGRQSRYYANNGWPSRNPHMRGTTTILRMLTGGQPGDDRAGEFLDLESGERIHLFDAFALVNVMLCSATKPGNSLGRSTTVMRRNCLRHFEASLRILQPTVIVMQGTGLTQWTGSLFKPLERISEQVDRVAYSGGEAFRCLFTHPSARGEHRWGDKLDAPYLTDVVTPAVEALLASR